MNNHCIRLRSSQYLQGILFAVLVALLVTAGCAPTNYVLTTSTTPVCDSEDIEKWQFIRNFTQGVAGRDPVGHKSGPYTARGTWSPYAIKKKTLCGTLHHFNFFDGSGAECDWCNFIIPDPNGPFYDLLRIPLLFGWADPDDVHNCDTANDCMEAEITPDEDFYINPCFPKVYGDERDESYLEGETICTYGPWVADEEHGFRPEIHPSELYWWKTGESPNQIFYLMLLQDDSNRYDRPEDYNVPEPPPDWWLPWSAYPRTGEFRIAFELSIFPAEPPLTFDIHEFWAKNVVTSEDPEARADSDNGKEHAIEYNGRIVLRFVRCNQMMTTLGCASSRFVATQQTPACKVTWQSQAR